MSNEISGSIQIFDSRSSQNLQLITRYQPKYMVTIFELDNSYFDIETMGQFLYKHSEFSIGNKDDYIGKLYRGWLRWNGDSAEIRVGLQKVNFGSAQILRSLAWFDTIDPRDPQENTDGVYSVLCRYYFMNNASIWLWGILSEDKYKGMEIVKSEKHAIEFGGRFQYPTLGGELALSIHRREIDNSMSIDNPAENKLGLDGRWDSGIGAWFESALVSREKDSPFYSLEKWFTSGADYTFATGNGIHVTIEHLYLAVSEDTITTSGREENSTAIQADYPLNMLDTLVGLSVYNWKTERFAHFLSVRRTYDYLSIQLNLFLNPNIENSEQALTLSGNSLQLVLEYNF
ncbi:MAG: hypothetical protein K8S56_07755 [Candidatus Cloacimonetes bacterium]|nr:hypothetical protein [Candidatus Cloacimonadota bacterium]